MKLYDYGLVNCNTTDKKLERLIKYQDKIDWYIFSKNSNNFNKIEWDIFSRNCNDKTVKHLYENKLGCIAI
jgi:hypothetical protein